MGAHVDFWQLTEQALDFAFSKVPSADRALRAALLEAYWHLDCYPEVPAVLKALKGGGARLAILSNGSSGMLAAAVRSAALDRFWTKSSRSRPFGASRPILPSTIMVTTGWRLYPSAVSFQSSNRWDIAGAAKFGFRTVWINRADQPDEYGDLPPELILPSLEGLLRV